MMTCTNTSNAELRLQSFRLTLFALPLFLCTTFPCRHHIPSSPSSPSPSSSPLFPFTSLLSLTSLPSWTLFVWLPCDMHTHEILGKNSKQIDGHDTPRKLDAYATDAYYWIIWFLHIICVQSAKIYAYLHCNINMHTLYFLCACYK